MNGNDTPATMTVVQAAKLIGISRGAGYRGIARGEIPCIRIGRRLLVPTAPLLMMLGIDPDAYLGEGRDAGGG